MAANVVTFPTPNVDRNQAIRRIRTALLARTGRAWSVKGGRGTAWGWIRVSSPPARRICGRSGCDPVACAHGRYEVAADDVAMLALALNLETRQTYDGVSIPASSDYYVEYVDRAEGREPSKIGSPYWD